MMFPPCHTQVSPPHPSTQLFTECHDPFTHRAPVLAPGTVPGSGDHQRTSWLVPRNKLAQDSVVLHKHVFRSQFWGGLGRDCLCAQLGAG